MATQNQFAGLDGGAPAKTTVNMGLLRPEGLDIAGLLRNSNNNNMRGSMKGAGGAGWTTVGGRGGAQQQGATSGADGSSGADGKWHRVPSEGVLSWRSGSTLQLSPSSGGNPSSGVPTPATGDAPSSAAAIPQQPAAIPEAQPTDMGDFPDEEYLMYKQSAKSDRWGKHAKGRYGGSKKLVSTERQAWKSETARMERRARKANTEGTLKKSAGGANSSGNAASAAAVEDTADVKPLEEGTGAGPLSKGRVANFHRVYNFPKIGLLQREYDAITAEGGDTDVTKGNSKAEVNPAKLGILMKGQKLGGFIHGGAFEWRAPSAPSYPDSTRKISIKEDRKISSFGLTPPAGLFSSVSTTASA